MGSGGTGGGGGGGGGGAGGGSSYFDRGGNYSFSGGRVAVADSPEVIAAAVANILRHLHRIPDYVERNAASPGVEAAYQELFRLTDLASGRVTWQQIEDELNIGNGPGCLMAWFRHAIRRWEKFEEDRNVRALVRATFERFLYRAIGDNLDVLERGTAADVMRVLDRGFLQRTCNEFVARFVYTLLKRQSESVPRDADVSIMSLATVMANGLVAKYEASQRDGAVSYRQLFQYARAHPQWFTNNLTHADS